MGLYVTANPGTSGLGELRSELGVAVICFL